MKRLTFILSLMVMMAASLCAKAQEVSIDLIPGWTWIGYPKAEVVDINVALGDFVPMEGDIIKSEFSTSRYINGNWIGGVTQFMPGLGYEYYSNRTEVVNVVLYAFTSQITVTTAEPTDITASSAVVGGSVMLEEGGQVFLRGVCWGTEPNPDMDGNHTTEEAGIGSFTSTLEGLSPHIIYYVRAYAVSNYGLAYGDEMIFIATDGAPLGAIDGKFTINNSGVQVFFAQGNLQYIGSASTPYWKFADNQWECLGTTTGQNSTSQSVDRDLFGWGTSGWNPGNTYYRPWDTYNSSGSSYGPAGANNLTGNCANSDWGVYNPISNGGNQPNQWRTLSKDEWGYVFDTRTTASGIRFAKANVNDVNGVILLPDDWNSNSYALSDTNTKDASFTSNTITATEWSLLERLGAVFLPATGYRFGTSVRNVGVRGYYWSSSYVNSNYAYGVYFYHTDNDSDVNPQDCSNRTYGRGVRLVHVAE